ncbi:hypothetical protein JHK82_032942 [Glycine max]|nr:hypothetical protein JHK82_032942 [Glycine max]
MVSQLFLLQLSLTQGVDSAVRNACRDIVGALAAQYLKGDGRGDGGGGVGTVVGLFVKPLFEAMGEQNKGVQAGAVVCMAKMVECGGGGGGGEVVPVVAPVDGSGSLPPSSTLEAVLFINSEKMRNVAVWIRRLPIELYNDVFLKRIRSNLSKFLKVDKLTLIHSRGKFIRICVKLDLEKPLEFHIYVRGHKLQIEGLHSICFQCGRFGHKKVQCLEITLLPVESQNGKSRETNDA